VNGQCPSCGRIYEFPGKQYDFNGKEIQKKTPKSSSSSSHNSHNHSSSNTSYTGKSYSYVEQISNWWFWLGLLTGFSISFIGIIIGRRVNRKMMAGAIVGTVLNAITIMQLLGYYLLQIFPELFS